MFALSALSASGVSGSLLTSHNPSLQFCLYSFLVLGGSLLLLGALLGPQVSLTFSPLPAEGVASFRFWFFWVQFCSSQTERDLQSRLELKPQRQLAPTWLRDLCTGGGPVLPGLLWWAGCLGLGLGSLHLWPEGVGGGGRSCGMGGVSRVSSV